MTADESLARGSAALDDGRWDEARSAFEAALSEVDSADAYFGLAAASWWLGDNHASVTHCARAYALFRQMGDGANAVRCALWLGITYKANFGNFSAANGWIARAERLLEAVETGVLHGWMWVARAYRMDDLVGAEALTKQAVEVAQASGDVDLELSSMSQLGLIRVGQGELGEGFTLIDEAMAAALAGEHTSLDTVVYTCCDMLNACELANDVERAAKWCQVADDFVASYGCPFLYAECRLYYGSVLTATGRWAEADRELTAGLEMTAGVCPGLHARALTRLATLRIRQGRLEEADRLLTELDKTAEAGAEVALSVAALLLARGDAPAAGRSLDQRLHDLMTTRAQAGAALDLLVDAHLASGDVPAARAAADRLNDLARSADDERSKALAADALGRVLAAAGDGPTAIGLFETALRRWSQLEMPFEMARVRHELCRALADTHADVAVDHGRRALTAFEALGATIDADRVAAFLRSIGISTRTGVRQGRTLTAREQEVLRLLGHGLSNPEIAERLHVSRKTASHHVSRILTKLDLRNRAEAAAYAARLPS